MTEQVEEEQELIHDRLSMEELSRDLRDVLLQHMKDWQEQNDFDIEKRGGTLLVALGGTVSGVINGVFAENATEAIDQVIEVINEVHAYQNRGEQRGE